MHWHQPERSPNDGTWLGRDWGGGLLRISREFLKSVEGLMNGGRVASRMLHT